MKSHLFKFLLIFLLAVAESAVGLPVVYLAVTIWWAPPDKNWQVGWLVVTGLWLAVFWGGPWWLGVVFIYLLQLAFQWLAGVLSNQLLRTLVIVAPVSLGVALIAGIDYSPRVAVYGLVSLGILVAGQKFFVARYEKKYL